MSHPPHVRVRVGVVVPKDDSLLLVRHRKGDRQYWMLPGGGVDYGESFEQCAVREVLEETGIAIEVERMLALSEAIDPKGSRHILNIYLLGRICGGEPRMPAEDVIDAVEFIPVAKLPGITLFPAIADYLIRAHHAGYQGGIEFLDTRWVD